MNKTLKVMTSAALLAGVVAPVAVTTADAANTSLIVTKVPTVVDDYESEGSLAGGAFTTKDAITVLQLETDDVAVKDGQRFRLELPEGVEFVEDAYEDATKKYLFDSATDKIKVESVTKKTLELEVDTATDIAKGGNLIAGIPLFVKVDTTGDLKVTLDGMDSSITSGTYTFAVAQGGSTSATIEEVKSFGDGVSDLPTIRIDENAVNAMKTRTQKVTVKLPNNVEWANTPTVELTGGFAGEGYTVKEISGRTFTFEFTPDPRSTRGTIYIKNAKIDIDEDASFGDITADISGDEVQNQSLVVAKYADYGVEVSLDNEVTEIVAGLNNEHGDTDRDDLETAEIKIKENVADSIVSGRETTVKFPSWVKVEGYEVVKVKGLSGISEGYYAGTAANGVNKDSNEVEFTLNTTGKVELVVKFVLSVQADKTGDITAELSGRAGVEGEAVVAKAVAPVSVEVKAADLQIGQKDQALADIIVTENVKGALKGDKFTIALPDDVSFSDEPTAEVIEGNFEIDEVKLVDSKDGKDDVLEIKIDGESTQASKIKISGAKITLDRTVPVGPIVAKIGGELVENTSDDEIDYDSVFEDKDYVAEFVIANVVTPAPGQAVSQEVKFTLGSTTYTVGGEEKTMDVAPFVEAGRTYMPIRYVAEAVGVNADSIFWDQATSTATLIKGDRVVQLTNGSKALKVNGASVTMDAAAKVKDGRTVLPVRFVGQALGATVNFNEADKTVTVK